MHGARERLVDAPPARVDAVVCAVARDRPVEGHDRPVRDRERHARARRRGVGLGRRARGERGEHGEEQRDGLLH